MQSDELDPVDDDALGMLIADRYLVTKLSAQTEWQKTFLAADQLGTGQHCIIQEFDLQQKTEAEALVKEFSPQLERLMALGNLQIQHLIDFFADNNRVYLVQEYVQGKTYQKLLQTRASLSEPEIVQWLEQILPILSQLHSHNISHGHLSPNAFVLRQSDQSPVLVSFGVIQDLQTQVSPTGFQPSLLEQVRYLPMDSIPDGIAADLFTLGITALILLTGQQPQSLFDPQTKTWNWERWKRVSDGLAEVLNRLVALRTADRFSSAQEVLAALNTPSLPPTQASPIPSIPPQYAPAPPPTIASPPQTLAVSPPPLPYPQTQHQVYTSPQPLKVQPSGLQDWQKAILIGIGVGTAILCGFLLLRSSWAPVSQSSPSPQAAKPSPNTSDIPPTSVTTPVPSPIQSISEQEASNLVNRWLQAKRVIFAPPYNRQPIYDLTTGELLADLTKSDGPIAWLENNNAYYRFGVQRIDAVEQFAADGNSATIAVRVTEERTLLINGRVDRNESDFATRSVRYSLRLADGQWKIADYRVVR